MLLAMRSGLSTIKQNSSLANKMGVACEANPEPHCLLLSREIRAGKHGDKSIHKVAPDPICRAFNLCGYSSVAVSTFRYFSNPFTRFRCSSRLEISPTPQGPRPSALGRVLECTPLKYRDITDSGFVMRGSRVRVTQAAPAFAREQAGAFDQAPAAARENGRNRIRNNVTLAAFRHF